MGTTNKYENRLRIISPYSPISLFPHFLIPPLTIMKPIILLLFFISTTLSAQERAMVWYFGDHSGINFSSGEPVVINDGALKAEAGCASICDDNGNLLFYTNGNTVWNRNHELMVNGDTLNGSQLVNQNSVVVPKPLTDSIYYLFTLNDYDSLRGFNYSVINMNMGNGLGKLVEKNVVISKNVLEKIAAIEHCNGQDYWIITHGYSNSFYTYLFTDEGFIYDTIKSKVGTQPKADIGYLKVSPAANKIVMPVNNGNILAEIFLFNSRNGKITQPLKILAKNENTYCYGVEFSPDGNLLYLSTGGKKYEIWQYDLRINNEGLFNSSAIKIASGNNFAMQLAPNGRIYIASENRPYLNVIEFPDIMGEECAYESEAVKFTQSTSLMGMPNFVQSWFYRPSFDYKNTCFLDSTNFVFNQYENTDSIFWSFGDLTMNYLKSENNYSVYHIFDETGIYDIELKTYHCGIEEVVMKQIEIFPYPTPTLISDTGICKNCTLVLDAGDGFDSYIWSDGGENRWITIYEEGTYYVEVAKNGCYSTDSVVVWEVEPIIELPNAFTPNGDGLNDNFGIQKSDNIIDFNFWIFNRRGEIVFQTFNVFDSWDGKYLGQPRYAETFVWNINYSYYNEYGILISESKSGFVSLIR